MLKKIFLFVLVALLCGEIALAQDRKELYTANMSRAIDAYQNNNMDDMLKYLEAEVSNNPKNGYAYSWLARVLNGYYNKYGYAVAAADKAIKYLPQKDKEYVSFAYSTRAAAYMGLEDYTNAIADYNAAIKISPSDVSIYQDRGDLYFSLKEYDLADKDFLKCISLEPTDPLGYMGVGRNAKELGKYEEAIGYFNKAIQLRGTDYSLGYSFRAESYIRLGQFDEAASDIVTALSIDGDNKAYLLMLEMADSSYRTMVSRLKVQADKEPNNSEWYYYLGVVSEHAKKYDKAIDYYSSGLKTDGSVLFYGCLADCYTEKGAYEKALQYINTAIEKDSTDLNNRFTRAHINYVLNNPQELMKDLNFCIAQNTSTQYWFYYRRGWYKELFGDIDGAIDDYTSSITLNQEYAGAYMSRGKLLMQEGEMASARKDLQKCIAIDTVNIENMDCAFYAYYLLGDKVNAKRLLDIYITHGGNMYDAACLYSLMGEKEKAIDYLRQAFEKGYREFTHIERDKDMDNIRDEEEYKKLVAQYKEIWLHEIGFDESSSINNMVEKISEIPFTRKNGITEVKCTINGLPLTFVFDTGAGDVTISSVEAAFMFKNGYLSDKDVVGRTSYRTASGDIVEGTVINIEKIEFGDMTLNNVRASVVRGQSAPLLLGQSVLSRLGRIEIDNPNQVIRITYQEHK